MGTRELVSLDNRESLFTIPFPPLEARLLLESLFAKRYVEDLQVHIDNTQSKRRISP